jgi:hypothetical protein
MPVVAPLEPAGQVPPGADGFPSPLHALPFPEDAPRPARTALIETSPLPAPVLPVARPAAAATTPALPVVAPGTAQAASQPSAADAPPPPPRVSPRPARPPAPMPALPHVRAGAPAPATPVIAPEPPAGARVVRAVPATVHAPEGEAAVKPGVRPQPAPARVPDVDIEDLVEKVERKLLRRIAAERERRGGIG